MFEILIYSIKIQKSQKETKFNLKNEFYNNIFLIDMSNS